VRVFFITSRGCPACDLSRRVFSKYIGDSIIEIPLEEIPEELAEKIWEGESRSTPYFAVILPDGEVLHSWSAIPEPEQWLADTCALCGTEENLKCCSICGGIFLCDRCRKRYFRRTIASLSYLIRGFWRDDFGIKRRR